MLRRPHFPILLACVVALIWQPTSSFPWSFQQQVKTRNSSPASASAFLFDDGATATNDSIEKANGDIATIDSPVDIPVKVAASAERLIPTISQKSIFMISLMGLSGFVEAICFRRFKVFPNMMTGNTVRCMDALADLRFADVQLYSSMVASYVSGGALYKFFDKASIFPNTPNLRWLAKMSFGLFCASDLVGIYKDRLRLFPLAIAFGMVNTATQEAIGAVTNAVTGHYGKIGVGLGEIMAMQLIPQTSADPTASSTKNNMAFVSSLQGVSAFVVALLSTHLLSLFLEAKQPWILSRLPPLGLSLGIAYFLLLSWYSCSTTTAEE